MLTAVDTRTFSKSISSVVLFRTDLTTSCGLGNKSYKLRENLRLMRARNVRRLLTFGGAFSNHIYAVARLAPLYGMKSIGVIRGDEPFCNPVLDAASSAGMQLHFVTRRDYRRRGDAAYQSSLAKQLQADAVLPEGGSNLLAVKSCAAITRTIKQLTGASAPLFAAVGTGATVAGMISAAAAGQRVTGLSVVNDSLTEGRVRAWLAELECRHDHWQICAPDASQRYGSPSDAVLQFALRFHAQTGIALDPVYNAPGLYRLLTTTEPFWSRAEVPVWVHSGGLTGAWGMRAKFERLAATQALSYFDTISAITAGE